MLQAALRARGEGKWIYWDAQTESLLTTAESGLDELNTLPGPGRSPSASTARPPNGGVPARDPGPAAKKTTPREATGGRSRTLAAAAGRGGLDGGVYLGSQRSAPPLPAPLLLLGSGRNRNRKRGCAHPASFARCVPRRGLGPSRWVPVRTAGWCPRAARRAGTFAFILV